MTTANLKNKLSTLTADQLKKLHAKLNLDDGASGLIETPEKQKITDELPLRFEGQEAFPATSSQARLWFLDQYLGPNSTYNIVRSMCLQGELDIDALESALTDFVERHDLLRSTFQSVEGKPYQLLNSSHGFEFKRVNLRNLPTGEQQTELTKQFIDWGRKPFDLTQDCLFRVVLFELEENRYGLLFVVHHIVADGWSLGILSLELSELYQSYVSGHKPSLLPFTVQFADYARWLHQRLEQGDLEKNRRYWQQKLSGELPVLALPLDYPRPREQTYSGKNETVKLNKTLIVSLRKLASESNASLFMVLLAGFKVLLQRYSQQDDIIIGTPFANRSHPELEGIFGYFVDNLPIRSHFPAEVSFHELLQQVRETTLEAYQHPYPFAETLDALNIPRDTSRSPVFSVMFALQNTPSADFQLPGITFTNCHEGEKSHRSNASIGSYQFHQDIGVSRFDMSVLIKEENQEVHGAVEYNQDLFKAETIKALIAHWKTLLEAIAASPDQAIAKLPLLTEAEIHKLQSWNATETAYHRKQTIAGLFEKQVEQTPFNLALEFEGQALSYHELNRQANQLAHYLVSQGVTAGTLVGICTERSTEMVVGLLGILKAGGAYLPLDPAYPADRLAFMLEDSQAGLLLSQHHLLKQLPLGRLHKAPQVVCVDEARLYQQQADSNPVVSRQSNHLAYVIYTSGTSGRPKGALLEHQGAVNLACFQREYFKINSSSRVLQFASLSFDAATWEMLMALGSGASLHLAPAEQLHTNLVNLLQEKKISHATLPPSLLSTLPVASLTDLKYLIVAGEACPADLARKWAAKRHFVNAYGPTEATVCASVWEFHDGPNSLPIGKPLSNTRIYILDRHLQPLPAGIPGELCIAGDGLARGYLNRPGLTAEKFVEIELFGRKERLYRSGDRARFLTDGNIEYLGRIDHQVKIRGFRIEPGEIEATLCTHPAIREAAVSAHAGNGSNTLTGYLVADKSLDTAELRHFLEHKLPGYMIPQYLVFLEALPLTPNGKVDRQALPEPKFSRSTSTGDAPRNETEQLLLDLYVTILKVELHDRHAHFFELGGHSLLAAQLVSRIRNSFEVELPLNVLFEHPRVAELAAWLDQQQRSEPLPALTPQPSGAPQMLSFAQQRLWFLVQLEGQGATYNITRGLRLQGELDHEALRQTFLWLLERHHSLRQGFNGVDGEAQVDLKPVYDPIQLTDLSSLPASRQEQEIQQLVKMHELESFDLSDGKLLRIQLLRLQEKQHILLLTMHHIISDGWSMGVLVREWNQAYTAFHAGHSPDLPALPIQYSDYAAWQRQVLQGNVLDKQTAWWRQQLQGAPQLLELPTDHPRPAQQSYSGASLRQQLDSGLSQQLKQLSQQQGCTLYMTLLAAFNVLLYRYSGQADILVGSPVANRTHPKTEGLIGFFVNTLVLRTRFDQTQNAADDINGKSMAHPGFTELLRQVRHTALEAYAHQDIPYEQLVEQLQPDRSLSHSPLFQVMFVLQNNEEVELKLPGLKVEPQATPVSTAKFDLLLSAEEKSGGLELNWEYASDLFEHATIERMAGHLQNLLSGIVTDPGQRITDLPLLTPAESRQLQVWNATASNYPREQSIAGLFEQQVAQTPDNVALVFEDAQLSYAALNQKANRLARHLLSQGVKPGAPVGLCMERSPEMIIGLLGILKAGAAYVPLDPGYPQERLAYLLTDSGVQALLVQQRLQDKLPASALPVMLIESALELPAHSPDANPGLTTSAGDSAYVMYTSGSTGQPKGVSVPHRAVVRLVKNTAYTSLTAEETFLQLAPLAFDASTFEIWGALLNGGRLVIMPAGTPALSDIAAAIKAHQVSTLWLTAGLFHLMVDEQLQALQGVRQLLAGGDQLSLPHVQKLLCGYSGVLINGYGPTENTTFSCCYRMDSGARLENNVPIGRPIANTRVYILDDALNPVPIGVPGTLYIAGDGLASGYLNQPALNAEKFISHPSQPGERLYNSGDKARYRADGNIEFLGRNDQQVKIRGFRIEPGEIEAALSSHAEIQEASVIANAGGAAKTLVAYIVSAKPLEKTALRHFLASKLPDYMIPEYFVSLDTLPLTPNGKIDRQALPAPQSQSGSQTPVSPRDLLERQLTNIWETVLKKSPIGIHDNFFDLGGHSLLALTLFERIQQTTGQQLPLTTLFQAPSIAQLAEILRDSDGASQWTSLVAIQTKGSRTPLFLVPPAASTGLGYRRLAHFLGEDQPVYTFEPVGADGCTAPHSTTEEMAAHYIREMRMLQPEGPYHIGGMCFGGHVAWEMAQQLTAQQCAVGNVLLLDPSSPANGPGWCMPHRKTLRYRLQRIAHHWRQRTLWQTMVKPRMRKLYNRISRRQQDFDRLMQQHGRAKLSYHARPLSVRTLLLQSEQFARQQYSARWESLATGPFEKLMIPGSTHQSLLLENDAHTQAMAGLIADYMERADDNSKG